MGPTNSELVTGLLRAFLEGDGETLAAALDPGIRWHASGFDPTSGTHVGLPAVMDHLFGDNHMADFRFEVVDILESADRVALVVRTSGRRGAAQLTLDGVIVLRIVAGVVTEAWDYKWDQRAAAEFMALPKEAAS